MLADLLGRGRSILGGLQLNASLRIARETSAGDPHGWWNVAGTPYDLLRADVSEWLASSADDEEFMCCCYHFLIPEPPSSSFLRCA